MARTIRKKDLIRIVENTVEEALKKMNLNESEEPNPNQGIQKGIQLISQIDKKDFLSKYSQTTPQQMAENVFNTYFKGVDKKEFDVQLSKNSNLNGPLRKLGGFVLLYSLHQFCIS